MITIFWTSIFFIIYCYFVYPLLLMLVALFYHPKISKAPREPKVSILVSVWNEEDVIADKIRNLLSADYPPERLEVLIGSDGSDDRTNEIVRAVNDPRVRLVEHDQRRGKMAMINDLIDHAQYDIIVFTDARQRFAPDTIKNLVANLADPNVGCVSGELIFSQKEGGTAKGINLYWNYEKFIRAQESRIHSMLGATGAIYAIRKELFVKIPEHIVLDDVFVPFKIIEQGYRAVFDDKAKAYDEVADSPREEHRRKTRTLFGNYQIFTMFGHLFIPFKSPIAVQLFSHKLLRVLVPFLMVGVVISNALLLDESLYQVFFVLQGAFYCMAVCGALLRYKKYGILKTISRFCYVPYVFCLLNFSALVGFFRFVMSKQEVGWEKARNIGHKDTKTE